MPKVKREPKQKKTARKEGSSGAVLEAEPEGAEVKDAVDSLVGLIDHDAEAEEHARRHQGSEKDEEEDGGDLSSIKKVFDDVVKLEDARAALQWAEVECPHCGETFEMRVDPEEAGQDMIQDCQVCCRPIQMTIEMEGDEVSVFAFRE